MLCSIQFLNRESKIDIIQFDHQYEVSSEDEQNVILLLLF